ncbi:MAG: MBL fold metallo-hydrolase [Chitinophagaceae bacterium]|nr:MAG: MBL fold metallo-hydrolase [Chitinophagaceae bacterium]
MVTFLLVFVCTLLFIIFATVVVVRSKPFGTAPTGARIARIGASAHYSKGQFQNPEPTPQLSEGVSMLTVLYKFFFSRNPNKQPPAPLPSVKSDLKNLYRNQNVLAWFGHSSYFILTEGKTFLVDPVLSGHASPFSFITKAFAGSDVFKPGDFPRIDYLVLTHDHWDHLDYKAVCTLRSKVNRIITGLGTGAHLERWGFDARMIIELDWWEERALPDGFRITATPARHFSGRGLKRNGAVWTSFALQTPARKIFLGGDSGYGAHFRSIGEKLGPFDLAILECGQYNAYWKYIHMMPEEVVQAAHDLGAQQLLPVHWGKFTLALHDWDEPIRRVVAAAEQQQLPLLHPMIGELVDLDNPVKHHRWWEDIRANR